MSLESLPAWLFQEVPLYAFLIALLTSPARWSRQVIRYFDPGDGGS